jgi:tetratricopeptide (TPR) repeat protein
VLVATGSYFAALLGFGRIASPPPAVSEPSTAASRAAPAIAASTAAPATSAAPGTPATPATAPGTSAISNDAPAGPTTATVASLNQIDHSIGIWSANLRANAKEFYSATNLGLLYHARGRLTGDVGDHGRAKEALDRALAIEPGYGLARTLHALVLQATHDFAGALAEAKALYAEDSRQTQALATTADALLELGDYGPAASSLETLQRAAPGPAVTARLAHLSWLRGDGARAARLAGRAYTEARTAGTSGAGLGWYAYLAGTIAFQEGDLGAAGRWYATAARDWPDSYLVLAGQARVAAARGKIDDAIARYRQAIAIAPQPDALAALGDLYALSGRPELATQQYATVRAIARLAAVNQQVYNRQLVLFDVNHGVELAEALTLAENELAVRKDIYGYDAYAWALLANGRATEADAAMTHALSLGTRDAQLLYHAGLIAKAVGDQPRARTFIREALALNPRFDPLQAQRARAALGELR